jgi:tetratricopeptide (TPR) repeat protein
MITLLISFGLLVFSYIIYIGLPSTKYKSALKSLNNGQRVIAIQKLTNLIEKHDEAGLELAKIKLTIVKENILNKKNDEIINELKDILLIRQNIRRVSINKKGFEEVEILTKDLIAKIYFKIAVEYLKKSEVSLAEKFFNETIKYGNRLTVKEVNKSFDSLIKIYYDKGKYCEKSSDFKRAITHYKKAISYSDNFKDYKNIYEISVRIEICKLKLNEDPDLSILKYLDDCSIKVKEDLLFRLSLNYAKNNSIDKCYEVLRTHFKDLDKNSDLISLSNYCQEYYKNKALAQIEKINNILYSEKWEDIEEIYKDIDNAVAITIKGFPALGDVSKIKPYLFSKLINLYFNKFLFEKVIDHIITFPKFYEEPELLKNAGIACLRIADDQLITNNNFKTIISIWLTAVYSNKVILNSLASTTWDDDISFTLVDSIGSRYITHDVENVNYDEVTDDNISIGNTQRELIQVFELAINNIPDKNLFTKVQTFYNFEKDSIEGIISTIKEEIFFATPSFAITYGLNNQILNQLAKEYDTKKDTNILEIGLNFIKDDKPYVFKQYNNLKNFISGLLNSISKQDLSELRKLKKNITILDFSPSSKKLLEGKVLKALDNIIKEHEDERIIDIFDEVIYIFSDSDQLKYQFANFIVDLCISKINIEKIKNEKALELLIKAYKLNKDNHRVINNLAIITKFNCFDMLNPGITESCKKNLELINSIKNYSLTQNLIQEIKPLLGQILTDINKNDPQMAILICEYIGLGDLKGSIFSKLRQTSTSLNEKGIQFAEKLKLIYKLTL